MHKLPSPRVNWLTALPCADGGDSRRSGNDRNFVYTCRKRVLVYLRIGKPIRILAI